MTSQYTHIHTHKQKHKHNAIHTTNTQHNTVADSVPLVVLRAPQYRLEAALAGLDRQHQGAGLLASRDVIDVLYMR